MRSTLRSNEVVPNSNRLDPTEEGGEAPHNILSAGDVPIVHEAEVVVQAEVEAFAYDPTVGRFVVVLPQLVGDGTLLVV